ncbi:MAG: NAD-dependent epimerase/dehydratase family protein [Solirubrobacterales bacterium]
MPRVCLIGAGFIANVHAEAVKSIPGLTLHAVADPNRTAAEALAARHAIPRVFGSIAEALASGEVDRVHVLTPPDRHAEAALPFVERGIPTLIEKPLAATEAECEQVLAAATKGAAMVGVSQNFVHHPAFARLRAAVEAGAMGPPRLVSCVFNVPLRQMAARQFGHWMFAEPLNILLEQAVHPLSQIVTLAGRVEHSRTLAGTAFEIAPGIPFYARVGMQMECSRLPAQMHLAVGQSFPFWQVTVVCDDGVGVADVLANRFFATRRTHFIDPLDQLASGLSLGAGLAGESLRGARDYMLSALRLKPRSDPFYVSIRDTVAEFHDAVDRGMPPFLDARFGAHLVSVCTQAARDAFPLPASPRQPATEGAYDVCVLGATGFIGQYVVEALLKAGHKVGCVARNTRNLAPVFHRPGVVVVRADVRDQGQVRAAIGRAKIVVNLAHGGGGGSWPEIRAAMVGSAEAVAQACLGAGVERLVHVGSIAGLYLGPQSTLVTGETPPDPKAHLRADYARAKAEADLRLMTLHRTHGLPVVILRPGLVVGAGSAPYHTGLGTWNSDQHCVGWNQGSNPLPFVLVEDVADAVVKACRAPHLAGKSYNLVGDVRLSARQYMRELAKASRRPLAYHPKLPQVLWLEEMGKWAIKRAGGRKVAPPSLHDLLSRGLAATFDCSDAKRDLGWRPVDDPGRFLDRGVRIYRPS